MIGIIDYGMGNLGSVRNACKFIESGAQLVTDAEQFNDCKALILPGVGAFADCMAHLREHGYVEPIREWIAADKPFLGICLGFQALFESSEESPGVEGLGVFPGRVVRFPVEPGFKVPQMGWNEVQSKQPESFLFRDALEHDYFYFVHSFYVECDEPALIAGQTDYILPYTSAVCRGRVGATQFHPEKSHKAGLAMLRRFAAMVDEA